MIGGPPHGPQWDDRCEVTFVQTAEDVLSAADGAATLVEPRFGGAIGRSVGYVQAYPGSGRAHVRSCRLIWRSPGTYEFRRVLDANRMATLGDPVVASPSL